MSAAVHFLRFLEPLLEASALQMSINRWQAIRGAVLRGCALSTNIQHESYESVDIEHLAKSLGLLPTLIYGHLETSLTWKLSFPRF